jgi:hypothetical protein
VHGDWNKSGDRYCQPLGTESLTVIVIHGNHAGTLFRDIFASPNPKRRLQPFDAGYSIRVKIALPPQQEIARDSHK